MDNAIKYSNLNSKIFIKVMDNSIHGFNSLNIEGVLIEVIDFGKLLLCSRLVMI